MLRSWIAAAVLAAGLSACQQVAQVSVADTAQAGAIAQATGDVAGEACWGALNGVATAAASADTGALATKIETKRAVEGAIQGPCAPLAGQFLLNTLRGIAGPAGILVP